MSGTLQAGTLRPGQKLLLLPGAEAVHAKAVHSRGVAVALATAGDHVEVTLTYPPIHLPTRLPNHLPSDAVTHLPTCPHPLTRPTTGPLYLPTPHPQVGLVGCAADTSIAQGSVLCEPQRPAPLARQVEVRLRVFGVQACIIGVLLAAWSRASAAPYGGGRGGLSRGSHPCRPTPTCQGLS